ncbi:tyrosine-type recombinase/integrase [Tichowtungia aerotolerans]|uniref:Tyrosine-type recombinase/integrase n=1 Tax=Tichowtungia aerotolerans TaxID=2697043 RepID=A0A6P1MFM4_9BACT|nr:tyrosine-type recombinase/integrase [Tichowtungia aerotolerans]QHI69875.1 tyrosine-type recombinase/integrase [Tichowtungia aerotolerans]
MGLQITRRKDGSIRSKWWYGDFIIDGKRHFTNLGVAIEGTIPASLKEVSDVPFERSRMKAQLKLDELKADARSTKSASHHLQELYEIKAGEDVRQVELKDIEQVWKNLPQRRKRSALWEKNQCGTLRKFREFIEKEYPAVRTLGQVTPRIAEHWLRHLEESGYAAATYNDKLHLLKGLFQKVGIHGGIISNPFAGCPTKIKTTVHHQPFTQKELNEILKHADKIMRPVFLVGMCTAMRQGDCCRLKWTDVDLQERFITVTTSKTGETAEIPLFPILREEIDKQPHKSEYVFPEVAALYEKKNFGMSWRVKQVLKAADIETLVDRSDGMQKASIKGFHSLRTTWITMALSAGVPMELVRRVTGHSTVDVVLKHYFRPGKEAFKTALETAMPKMLTGGQEAEVAVTKPPPEAMAGKEEELLKKIRGLLEYGEDLEKAAILRRLAEIEAQLAA